MFLLHSETHNVTMHECLYMCWCPLFMIVSQCQLHGLVYHQIRRFDDALGVQTEECLSAVFGKGYMCKNLGLSLSLSLSVL